MTSNVYIVYYMLSSDMLVHYHHSMHLQILMSVFLILMVVLTTAPTPLDPIHVAVGLDIDFQVIGTLVMV